jgi:uncharacterized alkaline shock family protein YloU
MLVFWLRRGCSGNTLANLVEGGEMSESGQQSSESPLLSDRGATIISDTVVTSIAGLAAQEVDGVHMGGGASRTASGVLGSLTGSESKTSGISVEVGRTEAAIDLKMGIEYDKNILQTVEEVRRRVTERIQNLTGLRIKELNATITDITFPEKEERRRIGSGSATTERDEVSAEETATAPAQPTIPVSEPDPDASERETAQVETSSQTETPPEEETSTEDGQPEEETAELRSGDTRTEEQPAGEAPETSEEPETRAETEAEVPAEAETSEQTETAAEARRRRRAEERARRRSRTEDS